MHRLKLLPLILTTVFCTCVRAQTPSDIVDTIFPEGSRIESEHFTGPVWVERILKVGKGENAVGVGNVTFPPRSRSNWHYHPAGQSLLVLGGVGYYQQRGEPVRVLKKGQTLQCPPNVEHWHGAANDRWFVQLAMTQEHPDGRVKWGAPVTDAEYRAGIAREQEDTDLAQQTDKRYRKVAVLASLHTLGRTEELTAALEDALDAGLTVNECKEVFLHLYAYTGFPRSINSLRVLMATVAARSERGTTDELGAIATPISGEGAKYERGKAVLEELIGRPLTRRADYGDFAPAIDVFLKEHLFADLFERDVLTYQEREVAVIGALGSMDGVEPMLRGHLGIALNLGLTKTQLQGILRSINLRLSEPASHKGLAILNELTAD